MQFKHPELLYALFFLLIPIIVHLFQFRKFQKEAFTNVSFLKEVTIQTRKSSQLKKWLTLLTRLLILAFLIIAFAQPFFSKKKTFNTTTETVIYLDNSFSMQAKGNQGDLLKRALQDIITNIPEDEKITLVTNDNTYKNTTIKAIKNELLEIDYSSKFFSYNAALLKCKKLFKETNSIKNILFISDFQEEKSQFKPDIDSLFRIFAVKLKPVSTKNITIDSAYIAKTTGNTIELNVALKNQGDFINNLPISLFNNDQLIAKTSVAFSKDTTATFSLPLNQPINGKITINDTDLQYDNSLFFNINNTPKINVLCINNADDSFLKRIYTTDEFNYKSTTINELDYNVLAQQNLIVLNELNSIPNTLQSVLKSFSNQGGSIIIIPSANGAIDSYNALLQNYNTFFSGFIENKKRVTTINFSHPLYATGVFENRVSNFQYPEVNGFYNLSSNVSSSILEYDNSKPFLFQSKQAYIFTAPLNEANSNFINSPLIVPTLYNIGKFSFKIPPLYFTIGQENSFDVSVQLHQDDILSLESNDINMIPKQQYYNNKVVLTTVDEPSKSGIYTIKDKNKTIQNVSFNYNRRESNLVYQDISNIKNIKTSDSITDIFNTLKSDTKVNELWKWFVIFALAFLIIEMLLLKYFK
ncbi:BatA domain-containing protein [Yeosuana marina]|uniref:BatA domain-containing protein n=1 Tax=Yeosuana marina TaxID=1565536 RepID=UPI0030C7EBF3